ncbi:hypothetical protein U9M48_026291 [Paspalum notatum var. saurae]|uniref:CUE domain-containing protein n=1 Tax=Paspalum notatum var. saurae TaxID=547442 RepID=A0AAQ3TUZ5_PASNO
MPGASTDSTASPPPIAQTPRFADQRTMEGSFQLNPNASPFVPGSLISFSDKSPEKAGPNISAESSSKGSTSAGTSGPSEYEENDMDPLTLTKMVFSMFPNVSTDFIDELLKANDFDINMTVDMLHELNSVDMFHDDAEDITDLHNGQGLPGDDDHHTKVPETESSSNLSQDLQNEKSGTTSDVESVLPKFSNINLLHNDLGLPDEDKPAVTMTSAAK